MTADNDTNANERRRIGGGLPACTDHNGERPDECPDCRAQIEALSVKHQRPVSWGGGYETRQATAGRTK